MKRIGIEPGRSFDFEKLDTPTQLALKKAAADGLEMMNAKAPTMAEIVNGWEMNTNTMGVYGNYYLKRAIIAMSGLGANLPEDAIFPQLLVDADSKNLNGNNSYLLHFNNAQGFQVANKLNRFAIGDRDNLTYNIDGSLDIYIQHDSPGLDKESNWLPAPKAPMSIVMRLYWPKMEALDGRWVPPAVKKLT
jgi:hypothetical protein